MLEKKSTYIGAFYIFECTYNYLITLIISVKSTHKLNLHKLNGMEVNWIIIGSVLFLGILIVFFLIRKNSKDKKEVVEHFNEEAAIFPEEDSEANDV